MQRVVHLTAWMVCLMLSSILVGCPNDGWPGHADSGNQEQRSITITQPAGDASKPSYPGGSTLAIRWTSTGAIANVRIELLYDPGASGDPDQALLVNTVIADSAPNNGAYDWVVPAEYRITADHFIRVSDAEDASVFDVSCEVTIGSAAPETPSAPKPSDGATGVSVELDLDWSDAAQASVYEVYFGTVDPPPFAGDTGSSDWTVGPLSHGETYYWKIIAANSAGSAPGPVWSFSTEPGVTNMPDVPSGPTPHDGATDVSVDCHLDWSDAARATSYQVYFGTSDPPPLAGETDSSGWAVAALSRGTTYYWNVGATNSAGSTPGPIWSFTTLPDMPGTPGQPSPKIGADDVPVECALDWSDVAWATSYEVYFGTTDPPPLAGKTDSSNWTPATLEHGTSYYWKVVAKNSAGSTPGPVWSFTTQPDVPGAPSGPTPHDGTVGVSVELNLDWSNAAWATSYEVYFGTSNPPPFAGDTTYSDWTLGTLDHSATYYWKVVAHNSAGSTPGPVWSFTTCPSSAEGMVLVPGGEFEMGDVFNEGTSAEVPVHAVYVDAFYMDACEVTNQQYAAALNWALDQGGLITVSGGIVYQAGSGTDYPYCQTTITSPQSRITWNGSAFGVTAGKENHPMALVSWYGAAAYCNWRSAMAGKPACYNLSTWECNFNVSGYRLATEAEWERAARGGTAGHRFPWADQDTIQQDRANYWSSASFWYDTNPTTGDSPIWGVPPEPYTSPVGFFTGALQYQEDWGWPGSAATYQTVNGVNGYGLYDMAGGVWEWVNDWYSNYYYEVTPHDNPRGPGSGAWRSMRGGSWDDSAYGCRVANRGKNEPDDPDIDDGFRCAMTPP